MIISIIVIIIIIIGRVPTNTTEKPTIRYGFEKIIERYAFESFYFECSFQTLQDDAYFYQIHWFANGQNIRVMQPVKRGHIAQSRWTLDTDLPTFNVNVRELICNGNVNIGFL